MDKHFFLNLFALLNVFARVMYNSAKYSTRRNQRSTISSLSLSLQLEGWETALWGSVDRATGRKVRRNTDAGSSQGAARNGWGFFSKSQLSVHSLLRCSHSLGAQSHAANICGTVMPRVFVNLVQVGIRRQFLEAASPSG